MTLGQYFSAFKTLQNLKFIAVPNSRGSGYISLGKEKEGSRGPSNHEDDDSEEDENKTIVMTGTRSDSDIMKENFKKVGDYVEGDVDQNRWEGMKNIVVSLC